MQVVLSPCFESALINKFDEINNPQRNKHTGGYYGDLNRFMPKEYFDRCATFLIIAENVSMPDVDWAINSEIEGFKGLPILLNEDNQGGYLYEDLERIAKYVVRNDFLPSSLKYYIGTGNGKIDVEAGAKASGKNPGQVAEDISILYLIRLMRKVVSAGRGQKFLVIDENDLSLIEILGNAMMVPVCPARIVFPDLKSQLIMGDDFVSGLLNFSPYDALSLAPIRNDREIRKYSKIVNAHIGSLTAEASQVAILSAMAEAADKYAIAEKVTNIFEIQTWIAKPLHYIPGVDTAMTIGEDLRDVVAKGVGLSEQKYEWFLLAAKMTEINVKEYLARKGNFIRR